MLFKRILACACCLSGTLLGQGCHTDRGTDYSEKAVLAYAESNHGPDGALFLDPYFKKDLEALNREKVLDAGCGAAPWAIYAASNGGDVYAVDIQENMIIEAQRAAQKAELLDQISLIQGDVAALPYETEFFDKAISICVACNLPPEVFEKHFDELARTLKKGGTAIIGAPTSLDIVFTDGSQSDMEVLFHISEVLNDLPNDPDPEFIQAKLEELNEVLSATFFIKNHRLALVTDEKDILEGEKIWRKLPTLVVPNRFYSRESYEKMFRKFDLAIEKVDLPRFPSKKARAIYNKQVGTSSQLGLSYVKHPPFAIYHVNK